jgi:hypothetical protein
VDNFNHGNRLEVATIAACSRPYGPAKPGCIRAGSPVGWRRTPSRLSLYSRFLSDVATAGLINRAKSGR